MDNARFGKAFFVSLASLAIAGVALLIWLGTGFFIVQEGQQAVITEALALAAVSPADIGLVEAHGTGTPLGDPIEVRALTQAWRPHTSAAQYCAIGSIKSNIGHCESAAGIAGITKVLLQLQHQSRQRLACSRQQGQN